MTCPTGKVQHATREAAYEHQKVLVAINHARGQDEKSEWLGHYPCPDCEAWHVGHQFPKLVYHYTTMSRLDSILETGALRPRNPDVMCEAVNERHPLLWFSRNTWWEQTVMKDARPREFRYAPPNGRAATEHYGKGLIRFGAPEWIAKLRWDDYCVLNKKSSVEREAMAQRGNPTEWLATDQHVSLSRCYAFEVYYRGEWVEGAVVPPDEWDRYIEERPGIYMTALVRLRKKMVDLKIVVGPEMNRIQPEDDAEAILISDYLTHARELAWQVAHIADLEKEDRRQEVLQRLRPARVRRGRRRKRRI